LSRRVIGPEDKSQIFLEITAEFAIYLIGHRSTDESMFTLPQEAVGMQQIPAAA